LTAPTNPESIRKNSAWMLGARILRTGVAALYFALLARSLGVTGYGAFTGACAMAGILAPFASLGSGNLLVQAVAHDRREFPACWGNCLVVTGLSSSVLILLAVLTARFVLPKSVPLTMVLCIAIAELFLARLLDIAGMAFQAIEQLRMTATLTVWLSLSRMAAAAWLLLGYAHATALQWSVLYLVSTLAPALAALCLVQRKIGRPSFARHHANFTEGLYFSISLSAQTIYNDIDKVMLARFVGLGPTGIYSAAYRMVDAAFSPVSAVLAASYARFFQHGSEGLRRATAFARRILPRALLYSLASCALIWLAAPYIPLLLGHQFAESVIALRMLSPLLVLRSLHSFAADSLTGAGYQRTRTVIQIAVAVLNILLNLAILPRYSWRGAVWTSLASDAAMALLLWLAVWSFCARERQLVTNQVLPQEAVAQP
jgi:O-antigen/teichoic acid export membrane protein